MAQQSARSLLPGEHLVGCLNIGGDLMGLIAGKPAPTLHGVPIER